MAQKPIFRDIWGLGRSSGYPGAFPAGLIKRIRKKWWKQKRLWLFSGSHKDPDGITVDIKPDLGPDVVATCEQLPFKDECFSFVMADPPYSEEESKRLYNLPYCNLLKVVNEGARVCSSGGIFLLLHRLITFNHPAQTQHWKRMKNIAVVGVYTIGGWTNMRALSVWRKQEQLMTTPPSASKGHP